MGQIKLIDYLKINPDPAYGKLSSRDKVKMMDNMLSDPSEKRGLEIYYDLSHSGRRINNRIYTVKGQRDGIATLTHPYPKPILTHHDGTSDPIGRFVSGQWEDLSNSAWYHFSDANEFLEVKRAFESDSPKRIYSVMKKYNLLTNKDWPGLGRMRVRARITDEKAIEKFLDGRYVTFSAGSTTDRHVCSICDSDWAEGDVCEHRHGKIYDGDICVFVTGQFEVLEGSVVNMPADDLSQVLSMELKDCEAITIDNKCLVDENTIYLSDSIFNLTENFMEHETTQPEEILEVHDSVDTTPADTTGEEPTASQTSAAEETAGSETELSAEDAEASQEVVEVADVHSKEGGEVSAEEGMVIDQEQPMIKVLERIASKLDEFVDKFISQEQADVVPQEEVCQTPSTDTLESEALDSPEKREPPKPSTEGLEDQSEATLLEQQEAAGAEDQDLVGPADSGPQTAPAADSNPQHDLQKELSSLREKYERLKEDHVDLLKSRDSTADYIVVDKDLNKVQIENPALAAELPADRKQSISELGDFEKSVVSRFEEILTTKGLDAAEQYVSTQKRYLPRGFHPSKYIGDINYGS